MLVFRVPVDRITYVITRLALTNYQSHRDTQLDFGKFTVIVGQSSSGKTSIIRGLKLLVSNARGTSYVHHDARIARIEGFFGDSSDVQIRVAVERGSGVSVYELQIPGEDLIRFTKCGTSVPDAISVAHDLGQDDLWVAGQFDRPYLLDETGSKVAKVLGDLTNVSMIFAAVRECNRRALEFKRQLTDRTEELKQARQILLEYTNLPVKLSACALAELALERARSRQQQRDRLASLYRELLSVQSRISEARSRLKNIPDITSLLHAESRRSRLVEMVRTVESAASRRSAFCSAPIPDLSRLEALSARRMRLRTILVELARSEVLQRQSRNLVNSLSVAVEEARARLNVVLTDAGLCPVCGASIEDARLDLVSVTS